QLVQFIKATYPNAKIIIFTGMNTRGGMASSIAGAVDEGYQCLAVYDLMADHRAGAANDRNPLWHREALTEALEKLGCTYGFEAINRQSLLERFGIAPAAAGKRIPAARLEGKGNGR